MLEPKVCPKPGENVFSYCFRVAEAYHYTHVAQIMGHNDRNRNYDGIYYGRSNFSYHSDSKSNKAFERLVTDLGHNYDDFVLNQYDDLLLGERATVFKRHLCYNSSYTKYCPECLHDDYYMRLMWDINFVTVCTKHERLLIDKCVECQNEIKTSSLMQRYCDCGYRFENMVTRYEPIGNDTLIAQITIQDFLLDKENFLNLSNDEVITSREYFLLLIWFSHLIDNCSTSELTFMEWSGEPVTLNFMKKNHSPRDVPMFTVLTTAVHQLIQKPAEHLHSVLQLIEKMRVEDAGSKYRVKLHSLRNIVQFNGCFLKPYESYVRSLTTRHIAKGQLLDIRGEKQFVSIDETRKMLGISETTVMRLVELGRLNITITIKDIQDVRLITFDSIKTWKNKFDTLLDLRQTAERFGLTVLNLKLLLKHKQIQAFSGPGIDGYKKLRFEPETIEAFLRSIAPYPAEIKEENNEWVSLAESYDYFRAEDRGLLTRISFVNSGQVRAAFLEGIISTVYLNKQDIFNLSNAIYQNPSTKERWRI